MKIGIFPNLGGGMKVIGLAGAAGAGKDSVGQMILDNKTGYARAFADPLKRAVVAVFAEGDLFDAARALFALTDAQMRDVQQMGQEVPFWGAAGCDLVDRLGAALESEFGEEMWCRIQDGERVLMPVHLNDRDLKEQPLVGWGVSPRQIMQRFGDAVRAEFGADVLLRRAELDLSGVRALNAEQVRGSDVVVYTDVHTDAEAEWIRAHGGVVVLVVRPGVSPVAEHATEQGVSSELLKDWISNESGLAQLRFHVGYNLDQWLLGAVGLDEVERSCSTGNVKPMCSDHWVCRVARQLRVDVDGVSDQQALAQAKRAVGELYSGFYYTPEAAAEILAARGGAV